MRQCREHSNIRTLLIVKELVFEKISAEVSQVKYNEYVMAQLPMVPGNLLRDSAYFADYSSTSIINNQIMTVLNVESPISQDALCRRVLSAWDISKIGSRINRRFLQLFANLKLNYTGSGEDVFYWRTYMDPRSYDDFRVPSSDEKTRRSMEHIPPEEIASAIKAILTRQIGLMQADLEREVSRIFGFARCTESMQHCIRAGLKIAIQKGWAVIDGDRVNAAGM
jgi:hypothetical protein